MSERQTARSGKRRSLTQLKPPGTPPGTLVTDPEAAQPVIQVLAYGPEEFVDRELADVDELSEYVGKWDVTWVNVDGLGDGAVLERVGELFGVHPLVLEDISHTRQRPKLEEYGSRLFMVGRMPLSGSPLATEQLSIFLGEDFVLTFQEQRGDVLDPVRVRLRNGRGKIRSMGADYLAYALLDALVDSYFPLLENYGEVLEELEDRSLTRPRPATMKEIHAVKQDLLSVRRVIWPLRDVLNGLLRDPSPLITDETRVYLRDCYDHAIGILDLTETYRELGSGLTDLYLSSVSNRMNEVMKVLTVIATIFIPLTFIAGVYGMNFNTVVSPFNMPELSWYMGYPFALGLMVVTAAFFVAYFRRRGWL